jgi:hypothetical protein
LRWLADKEHEEHDRMLGWVGDTIEPEKFDPKEVIFDNPQKRYALPFAA